MDYEKKYNAVLKTAKQWVKDGCTDKEKICLEAVFPELANSDDERIREDIMEAVENWLPYERVEDVRAYLQKQKINTEGDFGRGYNCGYEACLNSHGAEWFEKQKEQKSVKPIEFSNEFENQVSHLLASVLNGEHEYNEGFVKYAAQSLFGYAKKEQKPDGKAMLHVAEKSYQIGLRDGKMEQKPEEWDEEDEQIYNSFKVFCQKLIENKKETFEADPCYAQKMLTWLKSIPLKLKKKNEDVAKLCSNKWNEEDEDNLKRAINICINDFGEDSRIAKFLKSLPERFNLQSKQEWSKDEKTVQLIKKVLYDSKNGVEHMIGDTDYYKCIAWLEENKKCFVECSGEVNNKALEDQYKIWMEKGKCSGRDEVIFHPEQFGLCKPIEWSKEDECKIKWFLNLVISQDSLSDEWKDECVDWLKSLRPQSHWKPSKEQLDALKEASASWMNQEMGNCELLESLYADLKKLM